MFDRAACTACCRVDTAHVGLDTLKALAGLVCDIDCESFNKSDSPSRVDAALDSEHEIRRLAYAAQNDDDATRTVPGQPVHDRDANPALAEPPRQHAANADTVDGTPDGGTCRRGRRGE